MGARPEENTPGKRKKEKKRKQKKKTYDKFPKLLCLHECDTHRSSKTGLMMLDRPLNLNCTMITELSLQNTPTGASSRPRCENCRVRTYTGDKAE